MTPIALIQIIPGINSPYSLASFAFFLAFIIASKMWRK